MTAAGPGRVRVRARLRVPQLHTNLCAPICVGMADRRIGDSRAVPPALSNPWPPARAGPAGGGRCPAIVAVEGYLLGGCCLVVGGLTTLGRLIVSIGTI